MLATFFLLGSLFCAVSSAGLGKNTLFPNGLHDELSAMDHSYNPLHTSSTVAPPQICIDHAKSSTGCNPNTVQAVEVFYGDCSQSWVLCRCDNAQLSMDDMMYRFGEIPVGLRSYVGAALAAPANGPSAYNAGNMIVVFGDCAESVFVHEAHHSLDQGVSSTAEWTNAISSSSCVPDGYANVNEVEDFAQNGVLYTYQSHIGNLPRNPSCLQPQLDVFKQTRLTQAQTSTTCFPDKRPWSVSTSTTNATTLASAKFANMKVQALPQPVYIPGTMCTFN